MNAVRVRTLGADDPQRCDRNTRNHVRARARNPACQHCAYTHYLSTRRSWMQNSRSLPGPGGSPAALSPPSKRRPKAWLCQGDCCDHCTCDTKPTWPAYRNGKRRGCRPFSRVTLTPTVCSVHGPSNASACRGPWQCPHQSAVAERYSNLVHETGGCLILGRANYLRRGRFFLPGVPAPAEIVTSSPSLSSPSDSTTARRVLVVLLLLSECAVE